MPDNGIENAKSGPYSENMGERLAVLETIAAQTTALLSDLRAEMRGSIGELREEMRGSTNELRTEIRGLRSDVQTDIRDLRRVHDRDFRLTFGAIVTTALGLAYLIARVAHWM